MSDTDEFRYTTLGEGDGQLAGIMDDTPYPGDESGYWAVYFAVPDADAAIARIEGLGGRVVRPAEDTPYGRLATVADPTGAQFRISANNG
jgi:predicted enzyme related to lactoylglutathione lyase